MDLSRSIREEKARKLVDEARAIEVGGGRSGAASASALDSMSALDEARTRALRKYSEAVSVCPDFADAYVWRGMCQFFQGDLQSASKDAWQAFCLHPANPGLYLYMSFPLVGDQQRQVLRAGMGLSSCPKHDYYLLWARIADSHWHEGNFAAHVAELERLITAVKKEPENSGLTTWYRALSMGYEALGDYAKSEEILRAALAACRKENKPTLQIREAIVRARMRKNDIKGAQEALDEVRPDMHDEIAEIYDAVLVVLSGKKAKKLGDAIDMAEALAGKGLVDRFFLGVLYMGNGDKDRAVETFEDYCRRGEHNAKDWGVTLRWEIAKAREFTEKLRKK